MVIFIDFPEGTMNHSGLAVEKILGDPSMACRHSLQFRLLQRECLRQLIG